MPCPQCQHSNPATAKFCSYCGTKLDTACSACGHANPTGGLFCNECGAPLRALPTPAPGPQSYTPERLASRILASRAALEGERKQVTVLLADLKGSMELLADRDPEEARQLLDPVLERMMEAVHHYEGTVNQVMGDGIMALFGAPLTHEDHAQRACYAALRMLEQVGRYGDQVQRSHGVPIQIRVGLNSGDVVVRSIGSDLHMDYTAVGQTTHLAARMEQMAKPGSILLAPATLHLAEGYIRVRSLGPVPIKGLREPVEVFELLGAEAGRTRLQVSVARGLTRFVGRDAELDQMRATVERVARGRGEVVALVGEPGVGKSRLAWELTHSHRTDGWTVLETSALSYGKGSPWLPVIGLLKSYLGVDEHDDVRRVREKLTGKVLTLDEGLHASLPALQALLDLPGEDRGREAVTAEQRRQHLLDAVRRLFLRESLVQPLLLVFEDLHWIDADTQALLDSLVESAPSHRLLLLVNYRPEYRHAWGGKTYYRQIGLDPLPAETAETLLEALVGADASLAPMTRLLIARAQGNPLFLEESVRALAETRVLDGERGAYHLVEPVQVVRIPETVQAIIAARIDRLPPEDKSLLQSASVIGPEVPLSLLQAVADAPADEVSQRLARLQAAEFLYEARLFPDVEYTFKHATTHEVAYASLLHEPRRALHAKVVDAIERLYGGRLSEQRDRLVHHAFRGELWTKAAAHLRGTDEVASPEEIGALIGKGPESPGQLWWSGEHERAVRAAERDLAVASSFGNFAMRVVSICRLGQAHHALGNYGRAAALFRQSLASLGGDLTRERFGMGAFLSVWACSWLAWSLAERGEFAEGIDAGLQGAEIAESTDDAYSRAQAAFGLGTLHVVQGDAGRAIPVLEQGLVVARVAGIAFLVPFLAGPLGVAYALDGRHDRAVAMLEQTVEQATSMKLVANHALRLAWLGRAQLGAGRHGVALELGRRALHLAGELHERGQQAYAHRLVAEATTREDGLATAREAYGEALALAEALEMRPLAAACRHGLEDIRRHQSEERR